MMRFWYIVVTTLIAVNTFAGGWFIGDGVYVGNVVATNNLSVTNDAVIGDDLTVWGDLTVDDYSYFYKNMNLIDANIYGSGAWFTNWFRVDGLGQFHGDVDFVSGSIRVYSDSSLSVDGYLYTYGTNKLTSWDRLQIASSGETLPQYLTNFTSTVNSNQTLATVLANGNNAAGQSATNFSNLSATGTVTATGGFYGNGANLTNITASQVGAVATNDARYLAALTNITESQISAAGGMVNVATWAEFTNAVATSEPGDTIRMADGVYDTSGAYILAKSINIIGAGSGAYDHLTGQPTGGTILKNGFLLGTEVTNVSIQSCGFWSTNAATDFGFLGDATTPRGVMLNDIAVYSASGPNTHGLFITGRDIIAENLRSYNHPVHGIVIKAASNVVMRNVYSHHDQGQGLLITSKNDAQPGNAENIVVDGLVSYGGTMGVRIQAISSVYSAKNIAIHNMEANGCIYGWATIENSSGTGEVNNIHIGNASIHGVNLLSVGTTNITGVSISAMINGSQYHYGEVTNTGSITAGGGFYGPSATITATITSSNIVQTSGGWDDLLFPVNTIYAVGLTDIDYLPQSNSINFKATCNTNFSSDNVWLVGQLSHSTKTNSAYIHPHVHFAQSSATATNMFLLRYKRYKIGEQIPTTWTDLPLTNNVFSYSTGTIHQIANGAYIPGPFGISENFDFKIWSRGGEATQLKFFDIHFQRDGLGSDLEYQKTF